MCAQMHSSIETLLKIKKQITLYTDVSRNLWSWFGYLFVSRSCLIIRLAFQLMARSID